MVFLKLPRNLIELTSSYFSERSVIFNIGPTNVAKEAKKGCVQGSACGPIFWNILLNSLLYLHDIGIPSLSNYKYHLQAYADDLLLIVTHHDLGSATMAAEQIVQQINDWGASVGLKFNPMKTNMVHFHTKKSEREKESAFFMNGR